MDHLSPAQLEILRAKLEAELAQLEGYPRTLDLRRPAKMAAGATPRPPHGT
ncbi:MAG: hypothetical protein KC621_22020 [Myxococcales bacterium]|nr:hypothetical protein [Myxococcales bacterium]